MSRGMNEVMSRHSAQSVRLEAQSSSEGRWQTAVWGTAIMTEPPSLYYAEGKKPWNLKRTGELQGKTSLGVMTLSSALSAVTQWQPSSTALTYYISG